MPTANRVSGRRADRYSVLALALTAVVFGIDLALPLGVAAAVPYTFAVLLALRSPVRWFAPAMAVLCCVLTIAKMGIVPDRGTTELWKVIANRCLAIFAIGMTAFLGMRRREAEATRAEAEEKVREHLADLARMGRLNAAGHLAAGLAHELNQPLAAVVLQAEIAGRLAEHGAAPGALLVPLREIAEQSHRAAEIVRGLRRMLRRESPAPTPVNLVEVVRTVARLLDTQARRAGADVRLELANVPAVSGERVQLEQVVFNLIQNAIEAVAAVPPGARVVSVSLAPKADGATVTVRDSGPGLAPDQQNRLFERFFSTKPEGMGMGLAISRSIVEAHGGTIWATPGSDGGAVIVFTLPTTRR